MALYVHAMNDPLRKAFKEKAHDKFLLTPHYKWFSNSQNYFQSCLTSSSMTWMKS